MTRRLRRRGRIFTAHPWSDVRRFVWWPLGRLWFNYWPAIVVSLGVFAFLAVYSREVYFITGPGGFREWMDTLVSTVASVLLALVTGYVLFRWQAAITERERKQEMAVMLRSELKDVLMELQESHHPDQKNLWPPDPKESEFPVEMLEPESHEASFPYGYMHPRFFEQAYESKLFDGWLNVELQRLVNPMCKFP